MAAVRRLEPVAVGWGGLAASVGLIFTAGRDWPVRLALTAVTFLLGGLLAGIRCEGRRVAHATLAWLTALGIWVVFVIAAAFVDVLGGPGPPELLPGGAGEAGLVALWCLVFSLVGAALARGAVGRPAGRRQKLR
jgi:peptidoglycan/LPS O-acetylase OafA/YrhL